MKTMRPKILQVSIHLSVWIFLIFLPLLIPIEKESSSNLFIPFALVTLFGMILFYSHALLLIPELLYKKRVFAYIFLSLIILGGSSYLLLLITHAIFPELDIAQLINFNSKEIKSFTPPKHFMFPLLTFFLLGAGYRFYLDKLETEKLNTEREKKNLQTELVFLKGQINPHFLLNMMNNVISMNRIQPELVEPTLIKLSELLHYSLYLSDNEKVELYEELKYIKNYIELQKLRLSETVKLDFSISNPENLNFEIIPLIFIPLIENTFKHGVGYISNPFIFIHISVQKNSVQLITENYIDSTERLIDSSNKGGLGIVNVQRRLELAYPNQHKYSFSKKNEIFSQNLIIRINDTLHSYR